MNKLDRNLSENIRIMALVVTEICQRSTLQSSSNANLTRNQFTILKALSSEQDFQISDLARVRAMVGHVFSDARVDVAEFIEFFVEPSSLRSLLSQKGA